MSHREYHNQRQRRIPPHAPIRAIRLVSGMTLADVASRATVYLKERAASDPDRKRSTSLSEGALSAIELGIRGPSVETLEALEHAYGLPSGTLTTTYTPRVREIAEAR